MVYGGIGRAARNWECFHAIVRELEQLGNEETLLVQSGKPVAVFPTHDMAPRVIIANSNLVGKWANWEHFHELDRKGLMMYGQMTAGSWIYIGTQGILQGTFQTFAALAERHFGGSLAGQAGGDRRHGRHGRRAAAVGDAEWRRGAGRRRGSHPHPAPRRHSLLRQAHGGPGRGARRCARQRGREACPLRGPGGQLRRCAAGDRAPRRACGCGDGPDQRARSAEWLHSAQGLCPSRRGASGAIPGRGAELRKRDPEEYVRRSTASMVVHVDAMLALQRAGAVAFDYGNNIRRFAFDAGCADAFLIPGFVPEYIRPLFCTGAGPFRWVALSGDPRDIDRTDELALELFPDNEILTRWLRLARGRFAFQGLPARICWLGYGERARMGLAMNELVRKGEISAPIAIGRDHLDTGSVASPYRETEKMLDGSDAVADWPLLNALLNTASGATWVSFHHGGGVGMGYSLHAGQVTVADGTDNAARRIARVLNNDPGIGVARHADAGYELARKTAREKGIHIPMESR